MSQGEVEIEPYFSTVLDWKCAGCKSCISLCSFNAITYNEFEKVAEINSIQCKGCGTCVAACPSEAILQNHFSNNQIDALINIEIPKLSAQVELFEGIEVTLNEIGKDKSLLEV